MSIHLFCLPPAGSSRALFSAWKKFVPDNIRVVPIDYPGHGSLVKQALTHDPDELSQYVVKKIQSYGEQPFILFGHSVGAALAWRVEHLIRQTSCKNQIKLLVISGRPELAFTRNMTPKRLLNREGLIRALRHYNAAPEELFHNEDALEFFLTILRNDFYLSDNMLQDRIQTTDVPLMAFYGEDDPDITNRNQMDAWQQHSTNWLGCHALPGGHFFFNNLKTLAIMLNRICAVVSE
jgi:surfactin synthase thioesterase subunit